MKGKENRGGWLAGPGDGLDMVSKAVKSKTTEREPSGPGACYHH